MLLLVLRSLAVYAATAAFFLWLSSRFVHPLRGRVALAIALAPFLLTGRAVLSGGIYAPLDIVYDAEPFNALRGEMGIGPDRASILGDVVYQEIPWRKAVRAAVKRAELPLWNPSILAGEPLLAVQQPAVFHPGTWIGFLLPLAQAWTFEMSFRIFLALLCAYLFLRELGCREVSALLGGVGWALSNYMVFFLGYPLSAAAAPFPLLLLGLGRIVRSPGRRAIALVVSALLLIVTAGHPETVLHTVAAAGLFFLFELLRSRDGWRRRRRAVFDALLAGGLALGLSAILLLPLVEDLPHTLEHSYRRAEYAHQSRSVPWGGVVDRLALQASPLAVGTGARPLGERPFGPTGYAGSLLFPLALVGLFGRSVGSSRWFFGCLGLLGLSIAGATPAADVLARLPLFDIALNERLIFVTALSVCVLAALGMDRLARGEGLPVFLAGSAATLAVLTGIFLSHHGAMAIRGIAPAEVRDRLLLQFVPVFAACLVLATLPKERRAKAGLIALLVIFVAQRRLEAGTLYGTFPSRAFYPRLPVLEPIERGAPYRFVSLAFSFVPNVAALYGLEDVRGYEAMTFRRLWETSPMWCVPQSVSYNRVDDPTAPFLSFLNVRWALQPIGMAAPAGWPVRAEGDGVRLLENPFVLPRAFVPRRLFPEPDAARGLALLRSVRDFGERGVAGEPGPPNWIRNGEATVRILEYSAGGLALDVEAREAALVGTSITAWPGWKAAVDGRAVALVPYNHAFLAVRVPAGHHRLTLRYLPDSVRAGAVVTLISLIVALALLLRPHA